MAYLGILPERASHRIMIGSAKQFFWTALILGLAAWLVYSWVQTALLIRRFYTPLPMWDYWHVVMHLNAYRKLDLRVFWEQHNEHRIIFPEILFALDAVFFHCRQIFVLAASYCCYLGVWLIMSWTVIRDAALTPINRFLAVAAAGLITGWQGSALAIGLPFLLQWNLLMLSAVGALALLALYAHRPQRRFFLLSLVCGVVANYSSGNGLLLWPVLLLAALCLRLTRRDFVLLLGTAAVSTAVFFIGYRSIHPLNFANLWKSPLYTYGFIASYVGSPFGALHIGSPLAARHGILWGSANLLLLAVTLIILWRKRLTSVAAVVLAGYSVLTLSTAVVTALGRMDVKDPNFIAATASRYCTVPLANWAALVCALIWLAGRSRWAAILPLLLTVVALFIATKSFLRLQSSPWFRGTQDMIADEQWAALSTENDLVGMEVKRILDSGPGNVDGNLQILRQNRAAFFSLREHSWLGKPIPADFFHTDPKQPGAVVYTVPVEGGMELVGWSSLGVRLEPEQLVFVDQLKRIVGLGRRITADLPGSLVSLDLPATLSWVGFVNARYGSTSVQTYIRGRHDRVLIPIGDLVPLPAIERVPPTAADATIPLEFQPDAGWVKNQIPFHPPADAPPGVFYASYAGTDASVGHLSSDTFARPPEGCVVIATVHGPVTYGLSAELVDAATGQPIAALPLQTHPESWSYWKIPVPATVKQLSIKADDNGSDWGEWLAVSQPSRCK
jgi:hypothetical protein